MLIGNKPVPKQFAKVAVDTSIRCLYRSAQHNELLIKKNCVYVNGYLSLKPPPIYSLLHVLITIFLKLAYHNIIEILLIID